MKPTYEELEAKCAALDAKINVINELMEVAEQVNKLAQEETEKLAHERNMLAAELSAVDKIHNEAVFITDEHYEQCPPEAQKIIGALAVLKIPAYDAHLAELRAQGVEALAAKYESEIEPYKNYDEFMSAHYLSMQANAARKFAAQLRQGAEHE